MGRFPAVSWPKTIDHVNKYLWRIGCELTYVRPVVKSPTPTIVRAVPTISNFFRPARNLCPNGPGSKASMSGTTQTERMANSPQRIVKKKKPARQSNILADIPIIMLPSPNPTGLPALKHANAQFLRFEGSEYAAPSIPIAGGAITAEKRPRKPHRMFIQNGFWENPNTRLLALKPTIPTMKKALRPRRSVSWPKGSWRAPAERLESL